MTTPTKTKPSVADLDFDPENPRFLDVMATADGEERAIKRMLEEENLEELVGSIGNQGFFPGEPLLISPNPKAPGRFIVVEGNRRLAALRVLNGAIPRESLPPSMIVLLDQADHHPTEVDCFEFERRRDILKYLGFRHISGPRRWEPLSKARYLADLIKNFYQELDHEQQIRSVAKDIGSRRSYVAQLLTTLNLYDRAREKKFYGLQRVQEEDISFSLLSTALSYTNIVKHLNLPSREVVEVSDLNDDHAKELLSWMFAQDQHGETVLGESRRLKALAAVVGSTTALSELRKHGKLDQAYLYSDGPGEAFNTMMESAESAIASCLTMLNGEVEVNESHVKAAERISNNADNLDILIKKALRRSSSRQLHGSGKEG